MFINFSHILIGLLGVITFFILFINYKTNRRVNFYFLLFLLLFSTKYILEGVFSFFEELKPVYPYKSFFFVSIPTIYLYFKYLINRTYEYNVKDILHYVIPVLFCCFSYLNPQMIFSNLYIVYFTFIFYLLIYLISSVLLLKNLIWNTKEQSIVFNNNDTMKSWIRFLFLIHVLIIIRLIIISFYELFQNDFSFGENYSWISGIFFILILIKIWINPEILFGYHAIYAIVKEENFSKLSLSDVWILTQQSELKNIQDNELKEKVYASLNKQINRIEKIALNEKLFRNRNYTKSELAEKVNIPKSHINFIFKYHSKISYSEFIKTVRTLDAINLIESGYLLNHKLDALANKVGFSSYNPFFTMFKKVTGKSPMEYSKEKFNLK